MDDNDLPSKDIEKLIKLWQQEECLWNISLGLNEIYVWFLLHTNKI